MSIQDPRHLDRRAAEQLLGGAPMGAHDRHPPLSALLTAAAAPGRPDELAGEQAILAAFRSAQLIPVPRPRSLSTVKSAMMKVFTVPVAAVLAATTAGGVALAAGTGALPNPLARHAPTSTSGFSAADPAATPSAVGLSPDGSVNPKASSTSKGSDASKSPTPPLVDLCFAYLTGDTVKQADGNNGDNKNEKNKSNIGKNDPDNRSNGNRVTGSGTTGSGATDAKARAKTLDNPAFSALIAAAGGKDKVELFCHALLVSSVPANSDPRGRTKSDVEQRIEQWLRDHGWDGRSGNSGNGNSGSGSNGKPGNGNSDN
ncbi:hypothetical protein HC028_15130 [Planosporangium flavigriseum]|uniref:Uncharacterized protein n=1 Tax=Planosporangium flavigriseum TaxID=373681 RepID=A0A8J3PQ14_9ACTN|nr:hypothetical protein [Planosporangium flavigriseum]NJC65825.1 hypothetical protein [Planosporangium flavigriseum]GIG76488.1 hypothetical protein Pfl04_48920 [Planosporangium flavigriseum]